MDKQMYSSVLHSRVELEAINAQLQQQNQLMQEDVALLSQQVNYSRCKHLEHQTPPHEWNRRLGVLWMGGIGGPLQLTLPTRGTHNTPSLHQPRTPQSPTISGTKPQPSPRTVVPTYPAKVAAATGPAPLVSEKLIDDGK